MDIGALANSLTNALVPLLPYLLNTEKVTEKTGETVAGQSLHWAELLWSKLKPKVVAKPTALDVIQDVAEMPDDRDAQAALRMQLRKLLTEDPTLAETISKLLEQRKEKGTVLAFGRRNIAIGESVANSNIDTGDMFYGDVVRGNKYVVKDPNYFTKKVTKDEQPYDREVYKHSQWGDLKTDAISEFLALDRVTSQNDYNSGLNTKQQFEQFRFVRHGAKPTIGANLCFGESPNSAVASCESKCFYWKDENRNTGFHDDKTIDGNLVLQMEGVMSFLKRHLRIERTIGDEGRFEEYEVPLRAIQEAVANALVHREYRNRTDTVQIDLYDNKIEITSPGGLPSEVPLDALGKTPSHLRNPLIARIFYLYGYVERAGTGINRMKEAMEAKGLPPPSFELGPTDTVKVTLRRPLPSTSVTAIPVTRALHQLRAPVGDFVGRKREVETLTAALGRGERAASISGISGMGGIGKTELALLVAQRVSGDYPDAQVLINLQGTSSAPRSPEQVLAECLRAFLGAEARLPEGLDQLRQLFQSQLNGKRALIVLDNAADSSQVLPLLPPSGSALLVTSRQRFTLPGMVSLTLTPFTSYEARQLLLEIAPRAEPVAEQICELCGYLPLAIRAAGSLLALTQDLDPVDYVAQLKDERNRLQSIGAEGVEIDVRASFNLSYAKLASESARVFRLLSVFPESFDAAAAEAVCGDRDHAYLSDLVRRSLVFYEVSARRYRLHDLARLFADEKLSSEERAVAARRHATHYKNVLATANDFYLQGGEALARGLVLFDLEWTNIQAGHAWLAMQDFDADEEIARLGVAYPTVGVYLLDLRQPSRERIRWLEIALGAGRRFKDRTSEGRTLGNLGIAYANLGEVKRAIQFLEQALLIDRELGDRRGEGTDLGNLGNAYADLGDTQCAIQFYEQALVVARELGSRRSEGAVLGNLGTAYARLGDVQRATQFYEQQLIIARELGDRRNEGKALGNLGTAHAHLGETQRATEFYEQHLTIARELGDRSGEGNALWNMSLALEQLGRRAEAIQHAEQSLMIYEQIESPFTPRVRAELAALRAGSSHTSTEEPDVQPQRTQIPRVSSSSSKELT